MTKPPRQPVLRSDDASDADLTALGPDHERLVARVLRHDAEFAALERLTDMALAGRRAAVPAVPAPLAPPPRRSNALAEEFAPEDRDAELNRMIAEMGNALPERRQFLIRRADGLHTAAERKRHRRKALLEMRKSLVARFGGMSDRMIAKHIRADLLRRDGEVISSTGSTMRDRLVDAIILTGGVPSERTIREEIRPVYFGRD